MKILYIIPNAEVSGGVHVVLQHFHNLIQMGHKVSITTRDNSKEIFWSKKVPVIPFRSLNKNETFDLAIATFWNTVEDLNKIKSKRKLYLVQSDERNYYYKTSDIKMVEATYRQDGLEFVTMAKWIQGWLFEEFGKESFYIPNGIDLSIFNNNSRKQNSRPRFLVEGKINISSKGIAESYEILKGNGYGKWLISGDVKVPRNWKFDKVFVTINHYKMAEVYRQCDIMLKMSRVESFALPPLEMMACGGTAIIRKVNGLEDYAVDGFNCLIVRDFREARVAVRKLVTDKRLLKKLQANGLATAQNWSVDKQQKFLQRMIDNKLDSTSLYPENSYHYSTKNFLLNNSEYDLLQNVENHKSYIRELEAIIKKRAQKLDELNKFIFAVRDSRLWKARNKVAKAIGRGQL